MKITCIKYQWNTSTAINDINFFNSDAESQTQTTLELEPYLVRDSFGDFEYTFENIDETDQSLYIEASSFEFQLLNQADNSTTPSTDLFDFFELYQSNPYTRFKINVYDDDETLIFAGVLYKDGIACQSRRSELLDITVLGYEKEFRLRFENIPLIRKSFIPQAILPADIEDNVTHTSLDGLTFYRLIDVILTNLIVPYGTTLAFLTDYYMADRPYIYFPCSAMPSNQLLMIKTGYEVFYEDRLDRFTWFNSLLLAMGWRWFFYLGRLEIVKRSDVSTNVRVYDYNDRNISLTAHGISNSINTFQVDSVIINSGDYYGDTRTNESTEINVAVQVTTPTGLIDTVYYYLGGKRDAVYSSKVSSLQIDPAFYTNVIRPFDYIDISNYGLTGYRYNRAVYNFALSLQNESDNYFFRESKYTIGNFTSDITKEVFSYNKNSTLSINPYISTWENSGILDLTHARETSDTFYGNGNGYRRDHDFGTNGFGYTGHPAESVLRYYVGALSNDLYENYEQYTTTPELKKQFRSMLKNPDEVLFDMGVNEFVSSPLTGIQIINYPYGTQEVLNFSVHKMRTNYLTKKTNFLLLKDE